MPRPMRKWHDHELCLVHMTDRVPKDGKIPPKDYLTVHFAVNGTVSSHAEGRWGDKEMAVWVPYGKAKHYLHNAAPMDAFGIGDFKIPEGSHFLISKERAEKHGLKEGMKIGKAEVKLVDVEAVRRGLLSRGVIDGGTISQFRRHYYDEWAKGRWEKEGRPGNLADFKRDLDGRSIIDSSIEEDLTRFLSERVDPGIAEYGGGHNGMTWYLSEHPEKAYEFFGVNKVPEKVEVIPRIESPFHYAVQEFGREKGIEPQDVGQWGWSNDDADKSVRKKFAEDGFRSITDHYASRIHFLEEFRRRLKGIEKISPEWLKPKLEDLHRIGNEIRSVSKTGEGSEEQNRRIEAILKKTEEDLRSRVTSR